MSVSINVFQDTALGSIGSNRQRLDTVALGVESVTARIVVEEIARITFDKTSDPSRRRPNDSKGTPNFIDLNHSADMAVSSALDAFIKGRFLFFWGEVQVTDLDQPLPLGDNNSATFVRLIPMKGG